MDELLAYLDSIFPLSSELRDHLRGIVYRRETKRKDMLLRPGNVCRELYFIESGLVRGFHLKRGDEVNNWLVKEGEICIDVLSFFRQRPTSNFIQTLENGVLWGVRHDDLQATYLQFLEFNIVRAKITELYYMMSEERAYCLNQLNARERYEYARENWAWMFQRTASGKYRVPQKHVASLLGVKPETISRRKRPSD